MRWLLFGCLMVGAVGVGCGKKQTSETDNGDRVTVEQSGDEMRMTLRNEQGEARSMVTGSNVALPKDFPDDVPVFSQATPVAVMESSDATQVQFEAQPPLDSIVEFYEKQLVAQGWNVETSVNTADGALFVSNKTGRQLSVTIGTDNDGLMIMLQYSAP